MSSCEGMDVKDVKFDASELISISSKIKKIEQLKIELSTPRKATHWPRLGRDDWTGQESFGAPVLFDCDYKSEAVRSADAGGLSPGTSVELALRQVLYTEYADVMLAVHLLRHGMVGKPQKSDEPAEKTEGFDVHMFIASAQVHLGLSAEDAGALSMTEFQQLWKIKFPPQEPKTPSRDEYQEQMWQFKAWRIAQA